MDKSEIRKKSSTSRRKYKFEFALALLVAILAVLVDRLFAPYFLQWSGDFSVWLQPVPLKIPSLFFSTVAFGGLFLTVFVLFMVQTNIEKNIVMLIGVFFLIYLQALLKLVFVEGRPIFFAEDIPHTSCICDYGKPSGHALCSAGLLLFIHSNLQANYVISSRGLTWLKAGFWFVFVSVCLSRVYLAAHSFNQIILGGIFGALVFVVVSSYEEALLKTVIFPLTNKAQMRDRKAVFDLITMFVLMNFLLLFFWSYRNHRFEHLDNEFYSFRNCFDCLFDGRANFSNKIIGDALNFNALFGILFGAYLFPGKGVYWVGFGSRIHHRHAALRVLFLLIFLMPLAIAGLWRTRFVYFEIFKNVVGSILTGYLVSNPLAKISIWLAVKEDSIDRSILLEAEGADVTLDNQL